MSRKKWALLIILLLLVWGYIHFFYKTYSPTAVTKSADCVIAIDVKKITNTIIWNFITTPGQWNTGNVFKSGTKVISWKDMVKLPDYILPFHVKDQPVNAWYVLLTIKNEADFAKGLLQYQFVKINTNEYISTASGMHFYQYGNKILVANAAVANKNLLSIVAEELFEKKIFLPAEKLSKLIDAKSHTAILVAANNFLQQDALVTANFNKQQIEIKSTIIPQKEFSFTENNFNYNPGSLCSLGFTQPSPRIYSLLSDGVKKNISALLNFNIDSLLLPANKYYQLDVSGIQQRTDSAISYSFDEDFNKVENVVVNNLQEPAFDFTITGDSVVKIYRHWQQSNKLETAPGGEIFTAIPFVKSYCNLTGVNELKITSSNYQQSQAEKKQQSILFLNVLLSKIPADLFKYFPTYFSNTMGNIDQMEAGVKKINDQIIFNCLLTKKKSDLPIIKF